MSLLSLENIAASYGASQALFNVDLTVSEGEVVALMGRNGMGKSTTIKVICRLLKHQRGRVRFADTDLSALAPYRAARLGIGLVPEGRRCFTNLTVFENLHASARGGIWDFTKVAELFPRLKERQDQLAASLSGGEQQMLAIGRALMTNPRLLILDEATEGLAPVVRQEIWSVIAKLKNETGMSILVVDKSIKELQKVADSVMIVEKGCSVWQGSMTDLNDEVTNMFLGL